LTFANKLWQQDKKGEAEFFYKKLATVFLDTTDQYHEIFDPKQPQKFEQNLAFKEYNGEINQTDINGNKQGLWVAKYPNGFVKYEIYFKDNHPAGIYRKYYENGQLKAKMFFNDNGDYASAILYDENGTKVAMGYYKNHKKDSLWQYFANGNIVIAEEHYKNGIKDGVEHTYSNFTNDEGMQVIIEEKFWKNGKLDSVWSRSYADGSPKFIAEYKNGIREGKYIAFDVDGKVTTAGQYKNNEPDGTWKYWNDSTLSYIEIKYINGVPQNYDELTEQETQVIEQMEKEKGKFVEPNQEIQQKYGGGVGNEN
jgi:antitoxin component YwqK of YwqJK toxin-antitoxin module